VYQGSIALQVGATALTVNVVFVVVPAASVSSSATSAGHSATPASCAPTKLYPVFTSLTQGLVVPASWPLPIVVQVVDDCGNPMTTGRVATDFSNGDPLLSLVSLQNGQWEGIWFGHNVKPAQIVITTTANTDTPALQGSVAFTGKLVSNPNVPSINSGGVTSGAGVTGEVPVAPGDVITIAGQYFAAAATSSAQLPLTNNLGGTQVLLAGVPLPLIYSSSGKILAIVPYNLAPNAQYQIIVSRGGTVSGPESVTLGTAQPDILQIANTTNPNVAQNIWNLLTAGTPLNPASSPTTLTAGGSVVIYCTGLGAIDQSLQPNQAAPLTPVNAVNSVSVSIGGQNMPVIFAGLVPGLAGVYEITGTLPSGVPSGENVSVTVSVGGQTSAATKVSVQ
jgi:uncharacterized protein (TIGR03437 family)